MLTIDPWLFHPDAIDPTTRAANETLEKMLAQMPPLTSQTPAQIRAARAAGQGTFGAIVRLPHAQTRPIRGPAGEIPLRVIKPKGDARGVYLHIHGGGHTLGSEDIGFNLLPFALAEVANRRCEAFGDEALASGV